MFKATEALLKNKFNFSPKAHEKLQFIPCIVQHINIWQHFIWI